MPAAARRPPASPLSVAPVSLSARAILAAVRGAWPEPGDAVGRAWWEANERTPFFRHAQTARVVRQAHRNAPTAGA